MLIVFQRELNPNHHVNQQDIQSHNQNDSLEDIVKQVRNRYLSPTKNNQDDKQKYRSPPISIKFEKKPPARPANTINSKPWEVSTVKPVHQPVWIPPKPDMVQAGGPVKASVSSPVHKPIWNPPLPDFVLPQGPLQSSTLMPIMKPIWIPPQPDLYTTQVPVKLAEETTS